MVEKSIFTAKKTAFISFMIGSMLFILYAFVHQSLALIYIGIMYIAGATFLNGIVILHLLNLLFKFPRAWKKLILTCLFVLANIPITILYLNLILIKLFPLKG